MEEIMNAIKILEAINRHFEEGAVVLYSGAYILDEDISIKEAIEDCLKIHKPKKTVMHFIRED
jgi:translation elongation factor EF-Ts